MKKEIAVRLYNNPKFGKTFGKGMYYNAIFNGTLDLPQQRLKYLIDLVPFPDWQHMSTTDAVTLETVIDMYEKKGVDVKVNDVSKNILCSSVKRFDSHMKKPYVTGIVTVDLRSCELFVALMDEENEVTLAEQFQMRTCREKNGNSPDFFSSNYDAGQR